MTDELVGVQGQIDEAVWWAMRAERVVVIEFEAAMSEVVFAAIENTAARAVWSGLEAGGLGARPDVMRAVVRKECWRETGLWNDGI